MSKTGKREVQHEVICVPGQQWQHIDIWHWPCCPNVRTQYFAYFSPRYLSAHLSCCDLNKVSLCLSVLELKHAIQAKYKIATQHQVLVVNGGECMAAERRVCSYSAGTVSSYSLFVFVSYRGCLHDVLIANVLPLIFRKPTPYSCSTKRWSCVTGIQQSPKPPSRSRVRFRLRWRSLY